MSSDPTWLTAFRNLLKTRFAALPWQVPLLLRLSDGTRDWAIQLPDLGGVPADQRLLRIASVTKVYVAAALLRLAEEGRIDLQAPLATVIGDETARQLRAGGYAIDTITTDQVMRHISGLRDHCFSDIFIDSIVAEPSRVWSRADQIAIAMQLGGPLCAPGAEFAYSDTGYVILGEVVEQATGRPLSDAVPSLLKFAELGLSNSMWDSPARDPSSLQRQYMGDIESTQWHASFDLFGGGGLIAPLSEVDGFLRALFSGAVSNNPETLRTLFATPPSPSDDPDFGHNGLMFRGSLSGEDVWAHTGFWGLQAGYFPAHKIMLAAAFNRAPQEGVYGKDDLLVDLAACIAGAKP